MCLTTHLRVPRVEEALFLMSHQVFRDVVDAVIADLKVTYPGSVELAYLEKRYRCGLPVKVIRWRLRISRYRLYVAAASAHYLIYLRLDKTAPNLALRLVRLEWEDESEGEQVS